VAEGSDSQMTFGDLADRLVVEGWIDEDEASELRERARDLSGVDDEPLHLRALSFVGAWVSALFASLALSSCVALAGFPEVLVESGVAWGLIGASVLGLALYADSAVEGSMFRSHFVAAVGVSGLGVATGGFAIFGYESLGSGVWIWAGLLAAGVLGAGLAAHRRGPDRPLYAHLAFAASFLGQMLAVWAGIEMWSSFGNGREVPILSIAFAVQGSLAALLYRHFDSELHRFATAFVACSLAVWGLVDLGAGGFELDGLRLDAPFGAVLAVEFAAMYGVVAVVFAPGAHASLRTKVYLRPLAYACAVTIAWMSSESLLVELVGAQSLWPYRGAAATALIFCGYAVVDSADDPPVEPAVCGAAATVVLAVVSTTGVLTGLLISLIGLWREEGRTLVLGLVVLGHHLVAFYYLMEISLFDKSLMLMATGLVVLGFRAWMVRRPWYAAEETAQ